MKTKVVVIDGGGRGAALIHAYSKSPLVDELIAIPGNDLMPTLTKKKVTIYPELKTTSLQEILEICQKEKPSLIDVAQDNAVEAGLTDLLRTNGFNVIGPSKAAGQIEWDKAFSRKILEKTRANQPEFKAFTSFEAGIRYIKKSPDKPRFIKAAGLAEGKGALPAKDNQEAISRIKELSRFGKAAESFLIEDWLMGEEFSAFAVCDGENYQFIGCAQDHKRVYDGDQGENTGGMGCSTPPLVVTDSVLQQTYETIGDTLFALKSQDSPYNGILYFGGIVVETKKGPEVYVIEFNARWGDPEAEVLIQAIKGDFYKIALSVAQKQLNKIKIRIDPQYRVTIAAASKGYPLDYSAVKGKEIVGLSQALKDRSVTVYGAGVKKVGKKYFANGGRLFYITASGRNAIDATNKAYAVLNKISIPGENDENLLHFRRDIGYRDINRLLREAKFTS
jgi:phosphoribosylamine--glycine ligase